MDWKQKDSNDNKFSKFFNKNNGSRFNNKIYDRNFTNDNKNNLNVSEKSYHNGYDPTNKDINEKISNFDPKNNKRKFIRNNYKQNFKKYSNHKNKQQPKIEQKLMIMEYDQEILNTEKLLASNIYISKIKKKELEDRVEELKIKKNNEFPSLNEKVIKIEPKVTCWNNFSKNKIYSDTNEEKKNEIPKKIYDEHFESEFEGNDFIDDDESLIDEDYYENL